MLGFGWTDKKTDRNADRQAGGGNERKETERQKKKENAQTSNPPHDWLSWRTHLAPVCVQAAGIPTRATAPPSPNGRQSHHAHQPDYPETPLRSMGRETNQTNQPHVRPRERTSRDVCSPQQPFAVSLRRHGGLGGATASCPVVFEHNLHIIRTGEWRPTHFVDRKGSGTDCGLGAISSAPAPTVVRSRTLGWSQGQSVQTTTHD